MRHIIKRHTISVGHALDGLMWAVETQPNFKIHLIISCIAVFLARYFELSRVEWAILTITIIVGLVIEMINTAIEATTDAIDLKFRDDIKIAKDVSAGAMLVYAIGAIIIGSLIFIPKILELL